MIYGAKAEGGTWLVVHGDERSGEHAAVGEPVWSPDGTRCAYAAKTKAGWCVMVGKTSSPAFRDVSPLVWSSDGKTVRFAGVSGAEIRWCALAVE